VADPLLERACEVFGDDAASHLAYGFARESSSFATRWTVGLDMSIGLTPSNKERMDALSDARTALERALKLDPGSDEARVRLAHVHLLLKDERRAAPLLEQTLVLGAPPLYRYLASIMLGDVQARRGELQPAIELYLDARRLLPTGQSSYIAHAFALRAAGQADAAARVLGEMLSRVPHDDDPWMQYPRGFDLAATQLDPLRALVRKK
jgi:predicted Zn-dependent protease